MSKPNKHVPEPDTVVDNKPDTVNGDLGSPTTPLQTRPSGLTSTPTTSSCSSSSSESVTGRAGHSPVTSKTDSGRSNTSAAQSASINLAGVQLKSSGSSAVQSSKSTAPSAATQPSKNTAPSKSSVSSAAAQSGSSSPSGLQSGCSSPKTGSGNQRPGRGAASSESSSRTTKPPGKSSPAPQQPVKIVPAGNLFPSGKVQITGMTQGIQRSMVLGPGSRSHSYGYGSIIRGSNSSPATPAYSSALTLTVASSSGGPDADADTLWKKAMTSSNPEEVKRIGNEMFNKGCFTEALKLYDRAVELSPSNAAYHSNRAAALSALGQIGEAVIECQEAIKLNPNFARAHHRLATLLLRLGQVDNAGKHFFSVGEPSDPTVVKVLELVDKHLTKCTFARRQGDWNVVLAQVTAAMSSGADLSPQLTLCKVEALLKLLRIDDAQTTLAFVPKVEPFPATYAQTRFCDMTCEAYTSFVKSQMELALGRFENALTAAEKASEIDPRNSEVETLYRNVRLIAKARDRGNDLYESERYTEASSAYGEALKFDPSNATLLCHRADCFIKVGMWESSIEDCNHALLILPGYTKPLRQRAASYSKLERWAEAVSDYETLRKELSYDKDIAESLFHAQVALKKSRGEVVLNMEFGGEVEEISSLEEFKAALTRPGVSIVHFFRGYDQQCKEISVFMDALCIRYPSLHFLKVEIDKCRAVADVEKVRVVPTFKIYKLGIRIKEIVCPSKEALENSVRHYGL